MAEEERGEVSECRNVGEEIASDDWDREDNEGYTISDSSRSVPVKVSQGSMLPGKLSFPSCGLSSDTNDRLEGFSRDIVRQLTPGTLSSKGDLCSATSLKRKREGMDTQGSKELFVSDIHGSYSREPEGSNSASNYSDVQDKQKEYQDHLRTVEETREIPYSKLSFDEFLCQKPTDDAEFGPDESLDSIYDECMNRPYNWKTNMLEYRLRSNRYLEVKAKKKIKFSELMPYNRKN